MKNKGKIFRRVFEAGILLAFLFLTGISVSAASTCKVTFTNNSGTITTGNFARWSRNIQKNQTITLPVASETKAYTPLGWTTTKGGTTPLYQMGSQVKIVKNTTFYLVIERKKYTVSFFSITGKTSATYQALSRTLYYGKTMTLPKLKPGNDILFMGWSTQKGNNQVVYQAGETLTVTGNLKLYAVLKKGVRIELYSNDGKKRYVSKLVTAGSDYQLPFVGNESGYAMLGWSTRPNQKLNVTYQLCETIRMRQGLRLYAVQYPASGVKNIPASSLPVVNLDHYERVIFVGDSRTSRMMETLQAQGANLDHVTFITRSGTGLNWLTSVAYTQILSEVGTQETDAESGSDLDDEETVSSEQKPVAIIFNHGVNDLENQSQYIAFMKALAKELENKNCKLFYMSVNPTNQKLKKRADLVRAFNEAINQNLCEDGPYIYLDTYHYLMSMGFAYDSGNYGIDNNVNDGVHYSVRTYKHIFCYCMMMINQF